MTSHSPSVYGMWHKARTKIILTRRTDFGIDIMDHNDNGFGLGFSPSYYFFDDDISENDKDNAAETDNGVDEDKQVTDHIYALSMGPFNNTDFDQKLPRALKAETNDKDHNLFDTDSSRGVCGDQENQNAFLVTAKVNENCEEVLNDSVDMAISRDGTDELIETGHGDTSDVQQNTQRKINTTYVHKNVTYKVRDKKKPKFTPSVQFGWFDLLIGVLAIALFFVDISTDIELAVHYFRNNMWVYGGVTTGLIVGPSLVTCFLGLNWYVIDYNKEKKILQEVGKKAKAYQTPNYVWFIRFLFTLLQLGPVIRVIEYLYCGYKSRCKHLEPRERRRYYKFMLYEDVDSCLLRLFESFLEAAPQLTWQLYIVIDLKPQEDVVGTSIRALALLSSWGSLAISLTSYHKSLRNSHEEKAKMILRSLPFYFIWRACETGGRILCIAMFASAFRLWVFGPLLFHWAFMSCWLIMQKTTFYKNKCLEKVFNVICAYVMIFCFLNLREGQTRFRFLLFYSILYVENFVMLALWFRFTHDLGAWFHLWGFIVVLLLFVFHVTFQSLYYIFFHPTKNIKMCLPCNCQVICSSICYETQPELDDADIRSERLTVSEMVVEDKVI